MRSLARGLTLLLVLPLALTATADAVAEKPPKDPKPPPPLYIVTMRLAGDQGLATDSACGELVVEAGPLGYQAVAGIPPALRVFAGTEPGSEWEWHRYFPEQDWGSFSGSCHSAWIADSEPFQGLFMIWGGPGDISGILWHFDYYIDEECVPRGNSGKCQYEETVRENFTLSEGDDFTWDPATNTASGTFWVSHYLNDRNTGTFIGGEPLGSTWFEFTIELEPFTV